MVWHARCTSNSSMGCRRLNFENCAGFYGRELEVYCIYQTAAENHLLGDLCSSGILHTVFWYFLLPTFRHGLSASSPRVKKFFLYCWPLKWNWRTVPKWRTCNSRLWKNGWNICSRHREQSGKTFYFGYAKGWKCYKCSVWYCGSIVTRVVLYNTI